jgi:ribosomal protein S18 acetylase RimI-like enzyme
MNFRWAKLSDLDRVLEIVDLAIGRHPEFNAAARAHALETNSRRRMINRIEDPPGLIVVEVDGVVEGFATVVADCGTMYIPWICVHPESRTRGIGPALYRMVIEEARLRGYSKVWGVSLTSSRGVNRFLTRIGGRIVGTMKRHWFDQDYEYWELVFSTDWNPDLLWGRKRKRDRATSEPAALWQEEPETV